MTKILKVTMNKIETKKIRRNAVIGGVILFAIATLHLVKGHTGFYRFLYSLSCFLFIVGGFFPKRFKQITDVIGNLITAIILSIIFFIVITPMGVAMRIFGKDALDRNIDRNRDSYWIDRDKEDDVATFEKQY